ncbi:hypothetical protein C8A05DRAFT_17042 [Staphylotrichum tortipilum]|uniref:Uncharacterized protein n=1 Tax=Staphylotrichum tortipilum TaxID=2831512 RepID=A0AAN6MI90_9PEZI|nr:hypothetical protein C8A05DRAFT_17042 [Staphylotrichum longicolle]
MELARCQFLVFPATTCYQRFSNKSLGMGASSTRISNQITTNVLLPYAVALTEALQLPRSLVDSLVSALLDELYCRPARLAARAPHLPASLVRRMGHTHSTMLALATNFAARALNHIYPGGGPVSTSLPLPTSEHFRFSHAFYRIELFYTLFLGHLFTNDANCCFFRRQAPWENEQLGCVHGYLVAKLDQALFDYFTGPVDPDDQDYLDIELAQGVGFISRLTNARSRKGRLNILNGDIRASLRDDANASLPEALCNSYSINTIEISEELCDSVALDRYGQSNDGDTDLGPYEVWRAANVGRRVSDSVMADDNAWLRDRAYVLWDGDRVRKMGGFKKDGDEA